jgi:ABC-type antimicrobial peptide transport system permease subunit
MKRAPAAGSPAGEVLTVVVRGVAPDIQWEEFGESTAHSVNSIYASFSPGVPRSIAVMTRLRSKTALPGLALSAPRLVAEAIPGASAYDIRSMTQVREFTSWEQRFFGRVMAAFGFAAVFAAATGLYGLLAYFVASRRREIGVRLALGARPHEVARLVVARGARLAAIGSLAGIGLGIVLGRAASGILFEVAAFDVAGPIAGSLALLLVVVLASTLPAWRASRVQPGTALRAE